MLRIQGRAAAGTQVSELLCTQQAGVGTGCLDSLLHGPLSHLNSPKLSNARKSRLSAVYFVFSFPSLTAS